MENMMISWGRERELRIQVMTRSKVNGREGEEREEEWDGGE